MNPYFVDLLHEKELFLYALKEPGIGSELIKLRNCLRPHFVDATSMWVLTVGSTGPVPRERTEYFDPMFADRYILYMTVAVNMPGQRKTVSVIRGQRGEYTISGAPGEYAISTVTPE